MLLDDDQVIQWADDLVAAERSRRPIEKVSARLEGLVPDEAYRIQQEVARRRLDAGERLVGMKVGLTSRAMQEASGVMRPDYGHLFAAMSVEDGGEVPLAELMNPSIESELAFVLGEALEGPGVTPADVLRATAYVTPALEIVDTRYADWQIQWVDTVADNGSSARFVLADDGVDPRGLDLATTGIVTERDGRVIATAALAAVMEHPARAVAWLANALAAYGVPLAAGAIVLSGAANRAVPVRRNQHYRVRISRIGTAEVAFT